MKDYEFEERLGRMWRQSRELSGMSQDQVAKALGVSKKTVQNWESGTASPNFKMGLEWFSVIGVPMYPYLMSILYPEEIAHCLEHKDINAIREALHIYIDELDSLRAQELLYLLYGAHGSSPTGTIDVINAYLHLPLSMRVCITESIRTHYELSEVMDLIRDKDNTIPKIETINKYLSTAKKAVLDGKESYLQFREEE